MKLVAWIDRHFYPTFSSNWDDKIFRERILKYISCKSTVLDVGAGAGIVEEMYFKGLVKKICGIDLDYRVIHNDKIDEGKVANASSIPYDSETFDVVFADNVMEHLSEPEKVFKEIHRVLKPGGVVLFKTPNRSHYMPLIARLTPLRFHKFINQFRGRNAEDTFHTYYLSNSLMQVAKLARLTGFKTEKIQLIEGRPEYLRFNVLTYLFGLIYERFVNSSPVFQKWRILLIAEMRKLN